MSYIKLINGFWVSHERNTFNCTEIALFFYLLKICNLCHWPDSIKRNNTKIQADLCISYPSLSKARNKLKQAGIIDFRTTNGSSNVSYTFKKFLKVCDEVTNEVGDEVTNEVGDEVTNEVGDEVGDELNKIKDIDKDLNIIKEKNKKEKFSESISPISPKDPPAGEKEKKSCAKRKEKAERKKEPQAFIESIPEPELRDLFARWLKYKQDINDSYKSEDSLKTALGKLKKMSGGDISVATEIVENSIANNWRGLFSIKSNTYNNGNNSNSAINAVCAPVSADFSGTKSTL